MKYFLEINLAMALPISLQACDTDSNSNDEVPTGTFEVSVRNVYSSNSNVGWPLGGDKRWIYDNDSSLYR